jgi:cytochrome P450
MAEIEDQIRRFCVRCLDPYVGSDGFDIIAELASIMPMRVIGMLLGTPKTNRSASGTPTTPTYALRRERR